MSHRINGRRHPVQGQVGGRVRDAASGEFGRKWGRDAGLNDTLVVAVDDSTVVQPGRVRNRTKTESDEKVKKPADGVRKKSPPVRKAPARGRYVDEYARPAF
ncbi:MAG: hypothetical protein ACSLEZ_03840 [Thiobacillus sp.]